MSVLSWTRLTGFRVKLQQAWRRSSLAIPGGVRGRKHFTSTSWSVSNEMNGRRILRRRHVQVIIMVVLAGCIACAHGAALTIASVQGTWEIAEMACTDCESRKPAEIGTVLELGEKSIRNPLYGDCEAQPGYGLLKHVRSRDLLSKSGMTWPVRVQQVSKQQANVLYGFVTCEGINYMQMLFFSPHSAAYFYEGGLVFLLSRRGK